MPSTRSKGAVGENVASRFLKNQGFTIVSRNYLKKWGELDIVAKKDGVLHFFEVKSTTSTDFSRITNAHKPEENVHSFKTHKIRRVVQTFLIENKISQESEFHFHVLSVSLDFDIRKAQVKWIKDVIL